MPLTLLCLCMQWATLVFNRVHIGAVNIHLTPFVPVRLAEVNKIRSP